MSRVMTVLGSFAGYLAIVRLFDDRTTLAPAPALTPDKRRDEDKDKDGRTQR